MTVGDLCLIAVATVATVALGVTWGKASGPTLVRVPLGFLFVFFFPGYAVTSALFPEPGLRMTGGLGPGRSVSIGVVERLALSVGLSLFVVPLVSLALTLLSWQVSLASVLAAVAAVTLGATAVAAVRRLRRPPDRRWRPPTRSWTRGCVDFATASKLNALVAVLVVLAVGGVGAAIVTPDNGEQYTEFGLLTPDDGDGRSVAADYPTEFERGEARSLAVAIENEEGHAVEYTVVVLLQEASGSDGARTVGREVELDRFDVGLSDGQRRVREHTVRPTVTGEDLRLTYLLYRGTVPETPTRANAYRSVHLNVDVTDGETNVRERRERASR